MGALPRASESLAPLPGAFYCCLSVLANVNAAARGTRNGRERLCVPVHYEEREDWSGGVFANRYDITQVYDKNGNRTGYDKNVQSGHETTYGNPTNLTTTFDNINRPTAVSDADDAGYSCTITNDANMNITQIEETKTSGSDSSTIYSYFDMDALNRMTSNRVKYSDNGTWNKDAPRTARIKRQHELSATGAILKSTYKAWNDGSGEPAGDSLHHSWGQDGKHIQNTDTNGTSFGKPWHWAGAANNHSGPLHNPNADTASQAAYNVGAAGGAGTPSRWSYVNPTTTGDSRELWGQGQPEAKDSVNDWRYGKKSKAASGVFPEIESRFAYMGTVAPTDLDRATDAREKGRMSFFGSGYSYAGSSPRVTSEKIGRDINPLGRGDGYIYAAGAVNLGRIAPSLPVTTGETGWGASVNNPGPGGGGEGFNLAADGGQWLHDVCGGCCHPILLPSITNGLGQDCCLPAIQQWTWQCREQNDCNSPMCRELLCAWLKCLPEYQPVGECTWLVGKQSTLRACSCLDEGSNGGTSCPTCDMPTPPKIPTCKGCSTYPMFSYPMPGAVGPLMTENERKALQCSLGCDNIYPEGSNAHAQCLWACFVKYLGYKKGRTKPPPNFIDCADPLKAFQDCLVGVGSVPSLQAAKECVIRLIAACGCRPICAAIHGGNVAETNACDTDCCCRINEVPEVLAAPQNEQQGEVIAIQADAFICLCQRFNRVYKTGIACQ